MTNNNHNAFQKFIHFTHDDDKNSFISLSIDFYNLLDSIYKMKKFTIGIIFNRLRINCQEIWRLKKLREF